MSESVPTLHSANRPEIWPNFLVIGAPKSGTTSLYHYLGQHPDIFLSTVRKEGRFFSGVGDSDIHWPAYYHFDTAPTVASYQTLFSDYSGQVRIGDVSPDYYAYSSIAAPRVASLCGTQTRIIAILRNPVERAWSHYLQNVRRDAEFYSFEHTLDIEDQRRREHWGFQWLYADTGRYAHRLRHWFDRFDHVEILLQEDLAADGETLVRDLFDFLDIERDVPMDLGRRFNTGGIPADKQAILEGRWDNSRESFETLHAQTVASPDHIQRARGPDGVFPSVPPEDRLHPSLPPHLRARLNDTFAQEIDTLETLLGRDLSRWRVS
ncbi:sulfotransferase family protein [Maricaulis sp. CAU 1757]